MRLSMDEVRKQHDGIKKLYEQGLRGATASVEQVLDLFDTIEALQQENNGWQERYYELDAGHSRLFKDFCKLQKENEQLQAQVARVREALIFTKEKIYEQLSNYVNNPKKFKYSAISIECVQKIVRALADASDYHNPADVEALRKVREALRKARETISARDSWFECDRCANMRDALAAIDGAIGGKEDE